MEAYALRPHEKQISDQKLSDNDSLGVQLPPSCDPPGPYNPPQPLVWVVFGATGHIGRTLVRTALSHNDQVLAVGHTRTDTMESIQKLHPTCHVTLCDVRSLPTVTAAITRALHTFDHIDIIANCARYGVIGACEDQDEFDVRNQFETNFMGTLHIIRASLDHYKGREHGRYLIFSSTAGALGVPGLGPYCAAKYAVEGMVETMHYEIDPFSIKITLVEPSLVRRDGGDEEYETAQTWGHFVVKPPSEPYAQLTSPALHPNRMVQWLGDKLPTDAEKCAELVWQLAHCSYPPLRLLLGSYAIESIRDRMKSITEELEDWKHLHFPVAPDAMMEVTEEDEASDKLDSAV